MVVLLVMVVEWAMVVAVDLESVHIATGRITQLIVVGIFIAVPLLIKLPLLLRRFLQYPPTALLGVCPFMSKSIVSCSAINS